MVTLALWPSFSSLPQPQWCAVDLPAWFSSSFYLCGSPGPVEMGLLSQTQHFLPCDREAPHSWNTYLKNRMASPGDRTTALVIWSSGQASWSMLVIKHPPHAWDEWGLVTSPCLPALLSPEYNSIFCLWGRWAVSSMLRGYQPLWWWLTSSPKSKRHFGGSIRVQKHLFPRSDLFYRASYHITLLPILWWWKGRVHLSVSLCPLCLQSYISPCYGRSITYALFTYTKFTGSLEFTIGAQRPRNFGFCKN